MGDTFIKIQLKQLKIKTIKDLLYIVSNYQSGYIEAFLEHYSIEKYFKDYVKVAIGDREGMKRKPAPDTVFAALRELGRKAETAVYIGDSDVDLETAKNANIPCIGVSWGFRGRDFLEKHGASVVIDEPKELYELVY